MKPEMDINLRASNFPFKYDLGDISGEIDKADIKITGQDVIMARGDVMLLSFKYAEQLEPAIEAEAMEAVDTANNFSYNINLTVPSKLKVVNNDFDLELGGDLRIFQEGGEMNFLGTLETIRGKYFLFNQSFTVLPDGEIRFNNINEFNPEFHVYVETHLTAQGERLKAQFLLTGTLKEPKLTATEESQVGDNQFFEYMSFMSTVAPGDTASSPFTDRLTLGASELALNKVSQYFARKIGVETLEINPYYDGDELDLEASELRIGLYTTPNLYIYGATQLDFRGTNEIGFEYRFSRRIYLSGQRDEQDLYHLNMNLNWEF
jgi:autotransporter translocation and assembly factor TamB